VYAHERDREAITQQVTGAQLVVVARHLQDLRLRAEVELGRERRLALHG
jgi:hypothetical protein